MKTPLPKTWAFGRQPISFLLLARFRSRCDGTGIDGTIFIGESGRTALRLEAEYELLFTQRLILTPEVEVNFYGQNDADTGVGSGLSDVELGLRLRYEIRREFAPYIGVNWFKKYGNTADFARSAGQDTDDTQFVVGIRAWY